MAPKADSIGSDMRERHSDNPGHSKINGVILTGKRTVHNQFLKYAGVDNKALIEIDGKPMIQHVIDALNDSRYIESIYLVAPKAVRVAHVREHLECSEAKAREYVRNTDKGRRDFVSRHFNKDVADGHYHDLVINRGRMSIEEAAQLVVDRYCRRFGDVKLRGDSRSS